MTAPRSKLVIYAASAGNALVALTKFVAAWFTGSSAMLSEAIHSLVDTGNQLLLLYGLHRAAQPPDEPHPLGHGRELYFWSFIVAMVMFTMGAGVAGYEGVLHILNPEPIERPAHQLRGLWRGDGVRGRQLVRGLARIPQGQRQHRLFRGRAAEQGPADLHRAVRGQRRADRPGDRGGRDLRRRAPVDARTRWRRLDRHRAGARPDRDGAGA